MLSKKWLDGKLAVGGFWHSDEWRGYLFLHAWGTTVTGNVAWPYASVGASVNLPFPPRAGGGQEEQRA